MGVKLNGYRPASVVLVLSKRTYEFMEKALLEALSKCKVIFHAIYDKMLNA